MAIEMNFGWLNDYTGSKFAPITLANLVLLDTSSGSTETLFDFVDSENKIIKAFLKEHGEQLNNHSNTLLKLTHEIPIDPKEGTELKPMASQRAVRLVGADGEGNCDWTDNENHIIGVNVGNKNTPTFFKNGIPEQCHLGNTTQKLEKAYPDINSIELKWIEKYKTEYALTDGNQIQALNANITGVASYATQAWESVCAEYSKYSDTTRSALSTKRLDYDIELVTELETNLGKIFGDIEGIINTSSTVDSGNLKSALNLKDIFTQNEIETNGYGQANHKNTIAGTLYIPSFKIDTKGRITEIEDYQYNVELPMTSMDTPDIDKAYLVTVNAPKTNPSYIYSQQENDNSDDSKSIYIQWRGSGITEPILMGAAWNDYAEYRTQKEIVNPGYCVKSNDDGCVERITKRLSVCDGIVSDTFGFSIGKSETYQTPLAVSGRVLAYCEGNKYDYHAGDVVCASENGKVCKMTREEIKEYPECIVGIVSEIPKYEKWNNLEVNNRIWIKVK